MSWEQLPGEEPIVFGSEDRTELELLVNDKALLKDAERTTLYLSLCRGPLLAEIGGMLGVTESRACQIRKAALAKLRGALETHRARPTLV